MGIADPTPIIDFTVIEEAMKLMTKYKMKELTLADGTKLVKEVHVAPVPRKKKVKAPLLPQFGVSEDVLFAATKAPKLDDFNRFRVSRITPEAD